MPHPHWDTRQHTMSVLSLTAARTSSDCAAYVNLQTRSEESHAHLLVRLESPLTAVTHAVLSW